MPGIVADFVFPMLKKIQNFQPISNFEEKLPRQ